MAAPEDFDVKVRALRNVGRPPQDVLQEPQPVLRDPIPPDISRRDGVFAPDEARYDFLRLGEQIAASLVEAAEAQLVQADNMQAQTKIFAESIRAQIADKAKELAEMHERLRVFGATILDAHNTFHSTPPTNGKAT